MWISCSMTKKRVFLLSSLLSRIAANRPPACCFCSAWKTNDLKNFFSLSRHPVLPQHMYAWHINSDNITQINIIFSALDFPQHAKTSYALWTFSWIIVVVTERHNETRKKSCVKPKDCSTSGVSFFPQLRLLSLCAYPSMLIVHSFAQWYLMSRYAFYIFTACLNHLVCVFFKILSFNKLIYTQNWWCCSRYADLLRLRIQMCLLFFCFRLPKGTTFFCWTETTHTKLRKKQA